MVIEGNWEKISKEKINDSLEEDHDNFRDYQEPETLVKYGNEQFDFLENGTMNQSGNLEDIFYSKKDSKSILNRVNQSDQLLNEELPIDFAISSQAQALSPSPFMNHSMKPIEKLWKLDDQNSLRVENVERRIQRALSENMVLVPKIYHSQRFPSPNQQRIEEVSSLLASQNSFCDNKEYPLHSHQAPLELQREYIVRGRREYTVIIKRNSTCTCPDNQRGRKSIGYCKHILFVLIKILNVKPNHPCLFRKNLLNSELYDVFFENGFGPSANGDYPSRSPFSEIEHDTPQGISAMSSDDCSQTEFRINSAIDKEEACIGIIDRRQELLSNILSGHKVGVHFSSSVAASVGWKETGRKYFYRQQSTNASPSRRFSIQEFHCRDCRKAFYRKGNRDNHENRLGHHLWRRHVILRLLPISQ